MSKFGRIVLSIAFAGAFFPFLITSVIAQQANPVVTSLGVELSCDELSANVDFFQQEFTLSSLENNFRITRILANIESATDYLDELGYTYPVLTIAHSKIAELQGDSLDIEQTVLENFYDLEDNICETDQAGNQDYLEAIQQGIQKINENNNQILEILDGDLGSRLLELSE